MKKLVSMFALSLVATLLVTLPAEAGSKRVPENGPVNSQHSTSVNTITGWCLDLSRLLQVNVPLPVGPGVLVAVDPACEPSTFPITVPNGSKLVVGGNFIWNTNRIYPPLLRDELVTMGYNFKSNSPHEDFLNKIDEVKVEITTLSNTVLATYSFDPQKNFRLLQVRDLFNAPDGIYVPFGPMIDLPLNISLSAEESSRLPMFVLPGEVGPLPSLTPGPYRAWVYWHFTETHNDGLGIQEGNFIPAGWMTYGAVRFAVAP